MDKGRFFDNILGTIYDPKSANQGGTPVIATYIHYVLSDEEYEALEIQGPATKGYATKDYDIEFFSVRSILQKKNKYNRIGRLEYFTHAPEFVMKKLIQRVEHDDALF